MWRGSAVHQPLPVQSSLEVIDRKTLAPPPFLPLTILTLSASSVFLHNNPLLLLRTSVPISLAGLSYTLAISHPLLALLILPSPLLLRRR
jgi:hypothetical protein